MLTGLTLLGQVTGILAGFAVGGWLFDLALGSAPLGLATGVVVGSLWATWTVLRKVKKEIEVSDGEADITEVEPKEDASEGKHG